MNMLRWSVVTVALAAGLVSTARQANAQNAGAAAKPEAAPAAAPAGNAEEGKLLFMKNGCFPCHGTLGHGGTSGGPRISADPLPYKAFAEYLRHPKEMPPYTEKVMSEQEVANIWAYLKSVPRSPDRKTIPLLNEK